MLTSVPINQLTMQFEGNAGRQSDAYAFAQNLDIWHDQLVDAALSSAIIRNDGPFDDFIDCQPMRTVRLAWDGEGERRSTHLFKSHFWESSNTCGDAPDNQGSIRSAVIYDRGECARVEDLQPRLTNIVQRGWNELASFFFKSGVNPGLSPAFDNLVRHMFRASSYVRTGPGAPTDVRGGFVLAAAIEGSTADWLPVNDIEVQAVLDYELGLDSDGMLEVDQDVVFVNVDGGGLFADPISHAISQAVIEDQITGQVDTINAEARAAQFVDLQPDSTATCSPQLLSAYNQCFNTYVNVLRLAVLSGAANRDDEGLDTYTPEELTAMDDAVDDPARWSCGGQTHDRCMFSVPGKRLNIHPQAVDIVWFDGKEVDNPAYALWVAAHAATGQDRRRAIRVLCTAPLESPIGTNGDGLQERFARKGLNACDHCEVQYCAECAASGCAGCAGNVCDECCASTTELGCCPPGQEDQCCGWCCQVQEGFPRFPCSDD